MIRSMKSADNQVFYPKQEWHGKPYYSLDAYLKNTYGEKIYKVALNAGLTCPNRDGTLDTRGCIFCSKGGSGDFAASLTSSDQFRLVLDQGKQRLSGKQTGRKLIAYFQAYTNTYGPVTYLEAIFRTALEDSEVAGISIATRPDCLPLEVLNLLKRLKEDYPHQFIWIELGLQSIHEKTASFIRRRFSLPCFEEALISLHTLHIPVIVHVILGLPGETTQDMLSTITYLNKLPVAGIKLQLLHVLKDTDLAGLYEEAPEAICIFPDREAYLNVLVSCIEHLRPDMVIHRVTGDAPKTLLLAPAWSAHKRSVLNSLHKMMKDQNAFQGRLYRKDGSNAGSTDPL